MKWLVQHFGGDYRLAREATEKHKARLEWRPKGKANLKKLLLSVLPYLVVKKEQAKLLLEWVDLGYDTHERRAEIILELNRLNQKGTVETDTLNGFDEPKIQPELTGDSKSAPAETQAIKIIVPLKTKTFYEQAEHFQFVTVPFPWPTDEPDID